MRAFLILLFFSFVGCFPAGDQSPDDLGRNFDVNDFNIETCNRNDATCYSENLIFSDETGEEIRLIELSVNLPRPDPNSITVPVISRVQPTRLLFDGQREFKGFSIHWENPNGGQPAFCFQLCPPGSLCQSPILCVSAAFDGQSENQSRLRVFLAARPDTEGTREVFDLQITPLASTTGQDPLDIIEFGASSDPLFNNPLSEVRVGDTLHVNTEIAPGLNADVDPNANDLGQACTQGSDCSSGACFSNRACEFVFFSRACRCEGESSPGTCGASASCSTEGQACGTGGLDCCVGLTCTNGTCEGETGRCPL